MKPLIATFLLLAVSVLAGCASHVSPELRPYTAEETRELALEALNRRGLSFDEYHAKKAELLGEPRKNLWFRQTG
jgi:acyl-[acyl carrier protein]--UDP-N-acetylglucosamine O-acyltransferase